MENPTGAIPKVSSVNMPPMDLFTEAGASVPFSSDHDLLDADNDDLHSSDPNKSAYVIVPRPNCDSSQIEDALLIATECSHDPEALEEFYYKAETMLETLRVLGYTDLPHIPAEPSNSKGPSVLQPSSGLSSLPAVSKSALLPPVSSVLGGGLGPALVSTVMAPNNPLPQGISISAIAPQPPNQSTFAATGALPYQTRPPVHYPPPIRPTPVIYNPRFVAPNYPVTNAGYHTGNQMFGDDYNSNVYYSSLTPANSTCGGAFPTPPIQPQFPLTSQLANLHLTGQNYMPAPQYPANIPVNHTLYKLAKYDSSQSRTFDEFLADFIAIPGVASMDDFAKAALLQKYLEGSVLTFFNCRLGRSIGFNAITAIIRARVGSKLNTSLDPLKQVRQLRHSKFIPGKGNESHVQEYFWHIIDQVYKILGTGPIPDSHAVDIFFSTLDCPLSDVLRAEAKTQCSSQNRTRVSLLDVQKALDLQEDKSENRLNRHASPNEDPTYTGQINYVHDAPSLIDDINFPRLAESEASFNYNVSNIKKDSRPSFKDTNNFKQITPSMYEAIEKKYSKMANENKLKPCTECGKTGHNYSKCSVALAKRTPCIYCNAKHFYLCSIGRNFLRERKRREAQSQIEPSPKTNGRPKNNVPNHSNFNSINCNASKYRPNEVLPLQNSYDILEDELNISDYNLIEGDEMYEPTVPQCEISKTRNHKQNGNKRNIYVDQFLSTRNIKSCDAFELKLIKSLLGITCNNSNIICHNRNCAHKQHNRSNAPFARATQPFIQSLVENNIAHNVEINNNMVSVISKKKITGDTPISPPPQTDDVLPPEWMERYRRLKSSGTEDEDKYTPCLGEGTNEINSDVPINNCPNNNLVEVVPPDINRFQFYNTETNKQFSFSISNNADSNFLEARCILRGCGPVEVSAVGLIDTAADVSLIHYSLAKELNLPFEDSELKLKGLGDDSARYKVSKIRLSCIIEGFPPPFIEFVFHVIMDESINFPHKVVLGRDYLSYQNAIVNMTNKSLIFKTIPNLPIHKVHSYTIFLAEGAGSGLIAFSELPVVATNGLKPHGKGQYNLNISLDNSLDISSLPEINNLYGVQTCYYLELNPQYCSFVLDGRISNSNCQSICIMSDGVSIPEGAIVGTAYTAYKYLDNDVISISHAKAFDLSDVEQLELKIDDYARLHPPREMTSFYTDYEDHIKANPEMTVPKDNPDGWSISKIRKLFPISHEKASKEEQDLIHKILYKYRDAFLLTESDVNIGSVAEVEFRFKEGATPCSAKPRRLPAQLNEIIDKHIFKYLNQGVLENSNSSYSSNVHLVRKPGSDKTRLVCDFRRINSNLKLDLKYLRGVQDTILKMGPQSILSSFDLSQAYHLIGLKEGASRDVTSIITAKGLYRFKVLPFGANSSVSIFGKVMDHVFSKLKPKFFTNYMDDCLLHSNEFEEHRLILEQFLHIVVRHHMKLSPPKSTIGASELEFLGLKISKNGIRKSDLHTAKIFNTIKPVSGKDMRRFLGLINYQRDWVPQCSEIIAPLNNAINHKNPKEKLIWTDEMNASYELIKQKINTDLQLAFPDYSSNQPLQLTVDASHYATGATLSQIQNNVERIITHHSQTFTQTERRYSTIDKELCAIIHGVKSHRHYLLGTDKPFVIRTDHQPLVWLFRAKSACPRLYRALAELDTYNFTVQYIKGSENLISDYFSRNVKPLTNDPDTTTFDVGSPFIPDNFIVAKTEGGADSFFRCVLDLMHPSEKSLVGIDPNAPILSFRKLIVSEITNNPSRYGLKGRPEDLRNVRGGLGLDALPTIEFFSATAQITGMQIYIYIGIRQPVVFEPVTVRGKQKAEVNKKIHLQGMSEGLHFNKLIPTVTGSEVGEAFVMELQEPEEGDLDTIEYAELHSFTESDVITDMPDSNRILLYKYYNSFDCIQATKHKQADFSFKIGNNIICSCLDSGASLSLVSESAVAKFRTKSGIVKLLVDTRGTKIQAFDGRLMQPLEMVGLNLPINGASTGDYHPFYVMADHNISQSCMLLGADFIAKHKIVMEFDKWEPEKNCKAVKIVQCVEIGTVVAKESTEIKYIGDPKLAAQHKQFLVELGEIEKMQKQDKILNYLVKHFNDKSYSKIIRKYQLFKNQFSLSPEKVLLMKGKAVVTHQFLLTIITRLHDVYNHVGRNKIMDLVDRTGVWSPSIKEIVSDILRSCPVCQTSKIFGTLAKAPIRKIRVGGPFEVVAIDTLKLPKTSDGYNSLIVMVDHCTKWLQAFPVRNAKSSTVVDVLKNKYIPSIPRCPDAVWSDNGPEYTGADVKNFLKDNDIDHVTSPPMTPQCNGAVEIQNSNILKQLRAFCLTRKNDWKDWLSKVIHTYNHTINVTTNRSPASFLYEDAHKLNVDKLLPKEIQGEWHIGNPRYQAHKVGSEVLLKKRYIGDLVTNKMQARYTGIYKIVKEYSGGLLYHIKHLDGHEKPKIHYNDLRPFYRPSPRYLQYFTFRELYRKWWARSFGSDEYADLVPEPEPSFPPVDILPNIEEKVDPHNVPVQYAIPPDQLPGFIPCGEPKEKFDSDTNSQFSSEDCNCFNQSYVGPLAPLPYTGMSNFPYVDSNGWPPNTPPIPGYNVYADNSVNNQYKGPNVPLSSFHNVQNGPVYGTGLPVPVTNYLSKPFHMALRNKDTRPVVVPRQDITNTVFEYLKIPKRLPKNVNLTTDKVVPQPDIAREQRSSVAPLQSILKNGFGSTKTTPNRTIRNSTFILPNKRRSKVVLKDLCNLTQIINEKTYSSKSPVQNNSSFIVPVDSSDTSSQPVAQSSLISDLSLTPESLLRSYKLPTDKLDGSPGVESHFNIACSSIMNKNVELQKLPERCTDDNVQVSNSVTENECNECKKRLVLDEVMYVRAFVSGFMKASSNASCNIEDVAELYRKWQRESGNSFAFREDSDNFSNFASTPATRFNPLFTPEVIGASPVVNNDIALRNLDLSFENMVANTGTVDLPESPGMSPNTEGAVALDPNLTYSLMPPPGFGFHPLEPERSDSDINAIAHRTRSKVQLPDEKPLF